MEREAGSRLPRASLVAAALGQTGDTLSAR